MQCPAQMVSRMEWLARPANVTGLTHLDPSAALYVAVFLSTVTGQCRTTKGCSEMVMNMQLHHMRDNKFADISYNFLIARNGDIFEGRGWTAAPIGSFCKPSITQGQCYGFGFIGDFQEDLVPSDEAMKSAKSILACAVDQGYISEKFLLRGLFISDQVIDKLKENIQKPDLIMN